MLDVFVVAVGRYGLLELKCRRCSLLNADVDVVIFPGEISGVPTRPLSAVSADGLIVSGLDSV